jgi:predicted RNA binding protein YcfA (HicA-like mRNA interferase family)
MPRKIRQLVQDLEKAGFTDRGGKGSHRNYFHPSGIGVTISGKLGNDAKLYQEKQVRIAIENSSRR